MTDAHSPPRWHVIGAAALTVFSALAILAQATDRGAAPTLIDAAGAAALATPPAVPNPDLDEVSRGMVRRATPQPAPHQAARRASAATSTHGPASTRVRNPAAARNPSPVYAAPKPAPVATRAAPVPAAPAPAPKPATATTTYTEEGSADSWLLSTINSQRRQHGLPALTMDSRLNASAHQHSLAMAKAGTLSHQLPGEGTPGQRMSAQGVAWTNCGENAGMSGDTGNSGINAASTANRAMMAEGPGGGHYDNLMSSSFNHIGISVLFDPVHHTMWITEDFAQE